MGADRLILIAAGMLAAAGLAYAGVRLGQAHALAAADARTAATVRRDLDRLAALRALHPVPSEARADQDLNRRLARSLVAAGLPAGALASVAAQGERHDGATRIIQVAVRLTALRSDEFGAWLDAWRGDPRTPAHGGPWRLIECQLLPRAGEDAAGPGRFDAQLLLAAPAPADPSSDPR